MKIQSQLPILQPQSLEPKKPVSQPSKTEDTILQAESQNQPVTVSISKEGMEAYRKTIQQNPSVPTLEEREEARKNMWHPGMLYRSISSSTVYVAKEEDLLAGKDMADTIVSLWFSKENEALKEADGGHLSWKREAENLAKTYSKLYDEIIQGYQNGTREVRVLTGNTPFEYRVLTMEEELKELDNTYEKAVKHMEKRIADEPKNLEIIQRIEASREKWGLKPRYTQEDMQRRYDDLKTVPDDLGKRMLSIRDTIKSSYSIMPKAEAWNNIVDLINNMFWERTK